MNKQLLALKKKMNAKRPRFLHYDWQKRKEVNIAWRRPRGLHNKMRIGKWGKPATVNVGYRNPAAVRGLFLNGFKPVLIHNVEELNALDAKTEGVLLAKVGARKKSAILSAAKQKNLTILNVKNPEAEIKKITEMVATRKQDKKTRLDTKAQKQKASEKQAKKEEKKTEPAPQSEEAKEAARKEMEKIVTQRE